MSESTVISDKAARDKAVTEAYTEAVAALKDKYRPEFNELVKAKAKAKGYDWSPRLTKAEKAEAEVRKLLAENPGLEQKIVQAAITQPSAGEATNG